jgi:threonylcarbamoyladenosine tRNA methylthiotransferase MtaB
MEAVRQTRQAIRRARRARPDARLLVTGCAAEIEREQITAMPEVDGIVPNAQKLDARAWNVTESAEQVPSAHTRAFIAVQNGCDHACTFCVIPQGRGPSRSLAIAQVLREVERHLQRGAPEVVLTGVDVTSWGHDLPGAPKLGVLVAEVLRAFPEVRRLRMSSIDGAEIDPLLFDLLAAEPRVMPHLHLSLQHGADLILKRMKRRHSRADGADIIAGFPTESAGHHADNLSIIAQLPVVHGHIFPFSPRPGTPAARMPQLDSGVIKARAAQLRAAARHAHGEWLQSLVGKTLRVLAEADGTGYAENFARVALPEGTARGTIATITPSAITEGLLT